MTARAWVRPAAAVLAALAAGSALAACARLAGARLSGGSAPAASGPPPITAIPSATVTLSPPVCVAETPRPWRGRALGGPVIDADPVGVTAIWLPGLDERPCRSTTSVGDATVARRLAHDLAAAPRFPPGTFLCPGWDPGSVALYFRYADRRDLAEVTVDLGSCEGVTVPGHHELRATRTLLLDVGTLAGRDALGVHPNP